MLHRRPRRSRRRARVRARVGPGVLAAVLVVVGCADASQLGPGTTAAAEGPDGGIGIGGGDDNDAADDGRYLEVFDDPPTYHHDGVELRVTGMGITDATHDDTVPADIAGFLDDQVRTLVVLEVELENRSGDTVSVFPNLAELHVLDEVTKAKALLSDSIGRELADRAQDAGVVLWTLGRPFDEVVAAGELVLDASAPIDATTRAPVAEPIALTVAWDPPAS